MNRAVHIARELAHGIAHTCSAMLYTACGGDMFTSFSAACHLRQSHPAWRNRRRFVNALFFWQDDHCKAAWQSDYDRALLKVHANKPEVAKE